jgi:NADH-quinone oxidoreductase subunit F
VTVFEAEKEPGGMLLSGIPAYRLPRDVLRREIECLLDDNISLQCNTVFGRDVTIDGLFKEGFKAIFLATGAHRSWRLGLEGEDVSGVFSSMEFLKAYNLRGEQLAQGRVGIIGGGNSAVDAARVAWRQKEVKEVTIFYRRTRREMPAYEEEINDALEEGIRLRTLVSPSTLHTEDGHLVGIEFLQNTLGDMDSSGRRRPVPIPGSEVGMPIDTLVVAVGERPDTDCLDSVGIERDKSGAIQVGSGTFRTSLPGVFAGGDVVSGPNTVVDAIAAGKRVAVVIHRYFRDEELTDPPAVQLPSVLVEPSLPLDEEQEEEIPRAKPVLLPLDARKKNFAEVEMTLSEECATREAQRCLRCDLEFTQTEEADAELAATGGKMA